MATPSMGPDPILISRKEVDALYETLGSIVKALNKLEVDYIVTGGSLLGAIRQNSILFCDDDIDIAIIDDKDGSSYEKVRQNLQNLLGNDYKYSVRPWEGGDKVRLKRMTSVFVDIFTLKQYESCNELIDVIGIKKNGQPQKVEYVDNIIKTIEESAFSQGEEDERLYPFWHFNTRKAIEMWPKEVYRPLELFPLSKNLKFGPSEGIMGPNMPVLLLKRAFGMDCFNVYYQSSSHKVINKADKKCIQPETKKKDLEPLVLEGGTWEHSRKVPLEDHHYIPMQMMSRKRRISTTHNREQLFLYLSKQSELEFQMMHKTEKHGGIESAINDKRIVIKGKDRLIIDRPLNTTVYMDGVFDLFHIGHLEAIKRCAELGDKVIIGVTGDSDATGYKRQPIISQEQRVEIIAALREVDVVLCPCPLVVTEEFMSDYGIDLVVHGFANDADAERQNDFFEPPMRLGKFKRIPYYHQLSTTDIIEKIKDVKFD